VCAGRGIASSLIEVEAENCVSLRKILIVDDSMAEIRLMQAVLEQAGYWPVAISDPMLLEQMVEVERPGLILMDVVMPQRNGFQACRELKNNPEYNTIPVIMVTSKDGDSDKFWGKLQGADGYVVKPFTREQLLLEVQRFLPA
jgi:twitching motility two-component system response regulator PilH